jgi:hypothetical protein
MKKSTLRPHEAGRWVNCTGSVKLCDEFPAIESEHRSEARLEGLAFHKLAQNMLSGAVMYASDIVGTILEGVLITDEMYEAAVSYTDNVFKFQDDTACRGDLHVEEFTDLDCVYAGEYGYCDAWCYDDETGTLVIWDAKYGHRRVEAFENWQLINYAMGIIDKISPDCDINVSLRVSQPRVYHRDGNISVWDINTSELQFYFDKLVHQANETHGSNARCTVSSECLLCPGNYACDTFRNDTMSLVETVGDVAGSSLSGNNLALMVQTLRRATKQVKSLLGSYEEQAIAQLKNGDSVPGYNMEQGFGRKTWDRGTSNEEIIMMCNLLGVDPCKPVELQTPAKLIKLGVDADVINAYSMTPRTGLKLVELSGARMRQIFQNTPEGLK